VLLAGQVQQLDPAKPDADLFRVDQPFESEDEISVLSDALQDLAGRVLDFTERERRFTRDASHELRTPLTVVKIAVDRLLRDETLPPDKMEMLQRIKNSTKDMEQLTTAFLLLARDAGKGLAKYWVCVNDVVEAELERARIINPDSLITTSVDEQCRLLVSAPEKVVESVVGNLLRNALAYTDAGQVTIHITSDSVTIEDTGPGMQAQFRNQRQRGGFGVGLTIVKRLTDRFDWPILIESEPARGTRATIEFPGARAEPLPEKPES
jgi:signal transduction histidine kinase